MTRILLVDDHQTFLAGTAMILNKHGFTVDTASSGDEALLRIRGNGSDGEGQGITRYDLFVFDLKLPVMNGFELTERTLRLHPDALIVILTGEDLAEHYDRLMELGVTGMLEKSLGEFEFVAGLKLALQRLTVLPLHLARQLRTKVGLHSLRPENAAAASEKPLSEREVAILKLIAQGSKNKDIADKLFMSLRNVEYIISHMMEKLQAGSRQEAVMKGIERQWLKLGDD